VQAAGRMSKRAHGADRVFATSAQAGGARCLEADLKAINGALWDIENRTRAKEAAQVFDQEFIELTDRLSQQRQARRHKAPDQRALRIRPGRGKADTP